MSIGALGFFIGAAPGLYYLLKNLSSLQKQVAEVQEIAIKDGKSFDLNFSMSMKFNYLFRPTMLLGETDSPELSAAKGRLLNSRKKVLVRHLQGIVFVAIGSLIGSVIAATIH